MWPDTGVSPRRYPAQDICFVIASRAPQTLHCRYNRKERGQWRSKWEQESLQDERRHKIRTWLGKISILTRFHLDCWETKKKNKINDTETYREVTYCTGHIQCQTKESDMIQQTFLSKESVTKMNLSKEISRNILPFT